jgi:tetratricopeptide (TPR) repeat protein
MKQAGTLINEKKFGDAEQLLTQATELHPSNPEAFRYLGVVLTQEGKYDQALEALNKAAKYAEVMASLPQTPGSTPPPYPYPQILADAQARIKQMPVAKGINAYSQQKFEDAIAIFTEALKADPNNVDLYYYMAASQANSQKYDEGLAVIDKAIQLQPGAAKLQELKSKIADLKKNAEINKANTVLKEGNALLDKDDAAGALKKFEEARGIVPQDSQSVIWKQIGKAQAKLNQPDAAIEAFKKSIELAKDEKTALDCRRVFANFYIEQKKYEDAVNVLAEAKTANAQNVEETLMTLFKDTKNSGEPELAEAIMERVIKLNPQNAEAYFELGQMYFSDGKAKDKRTKELFTKYIEIGKDQEKLDLIKNNYLVIINRRTK